MSINLKKLRELIKTVENLPDNTPIVLDCGDHSYSKIDEFQVVDAECDNRGNLAEWYGEEHAAPNTTVVKAIRIN